MDDSSKKEMSFLEHLEALRWHIIRSVVAILLLAIICFCFKGILFDTIIFGPKNPEFITYKLFCKLGTYLHLDICIQSITFELINTQMAGQFTLHMWVSFLSGLVLAFPYVLWELWRFVRPALHTGERKYTRGIVLYWTFLFLTGVSFGYFILVPMSVNFLGSYQVSAQVQNMINMDSFISTVTLLTLASGIVFELPVLIYFLSKMGLVTPQLMRTYRKHSFVIILIISAIITPTPDISGQLLVSIPLLLLYEISIFVSASVLRKPKIES